MADRFDDYASEVAAGLQQGAGDLTRNAIAGIGDAYQQVLTADATVGASQPMTGTMETVSFEKEGEQPASALETDPAPETDSPASDIGMER